MSGYRNKVVLATIADKYAPKKKHEKRRMGLLKRSDLPRLKRLMRGEDSSESSISLDWERESLMVESGRDLVSDNAARLYKSLRQSGTRFEHPDTGLSIRGYHIAVASILTSIITRDHRHMIGFMVVVMVYIFLVSLKWFNFFADDHQFQHCWRQLFSLLHNAGTESKRWLSEKSDRPGWGAVASTVIKYGVDSSYRSFAEARRERIERRLGYVKDAFSNIPRFVHKTE